MTADRTEEVKRRSRPGPGNPLRRGSDRAETAVLGVLLAAFLAAAPFAARAAGGWTYATSAREAQAQQAALHRVAATLLQTAEPLTARGYGSDAKARWTAPDGNACTSGYPHPPTPRRAARS
jgi:hypothetical protein